MKSYQPRLLAPRIKAALARHKSILLLGARQTGKTTLIKHTCRADLVHNLIIPSERLQFERNPDSLRTEVDALRLKKIDATPLIVIDEVQKVPELMNMAQYLIDEHRAQFILTGSSARKLKNNNTAGINLLPGRVVALHLDALALPELPNPLPALENLLLYGSLPGIRCDETDAQREEDLISYTETYLEEEIRQEALVRDIGSFSRFLELAAVSLGQPINFTKLSQEIGVNIHALIEYFQILQDCLITDRIEPITENKNRRRLTKAPKFLFFDLGIRRISAREGTALSQKTMAMLFEQFIGMELLRHLRLNAPHFRLKYWRDHNGPEVDYVIDMNNTYLPIEIKWTTNPSIKDCAHLMKFMQEYTCVEMAYLICRVTHPRQITPRIIALPWEMLTTWHLPTE